MDEEKLNKAIEETNKLTAQLQQRFTEFEEGLITKAHFEEVKTKFEGRLDQLADEIVELKKPRTQALDTKDKQPTDFMKAFGLFLRKGISALSPEQYKLLDPTEQKVMTVSDDTTGGYLAPPEYVEEIIKGIVEFSPVRSVARIRQTSRNSAWVPKRTGTFSAQWTSEVGERTETTGLKYGLEQCVVNEMYALIRISKQDLEDSAFNLEGEIRQEAVEQLGVCEGTAFINGNAVKKPEGILQNTEIGGITGAGSGVVGADDLIGLQFELKEGYARNATWLFKRSTTKAVRLLKEATTNAYIWQPGLQAGQPPSLLGSPYVECPDMPTVAANAKAVAYGDFRRGYWIIDRIQIEMQRLVEKYAEYGQVGFHVRKRVHGQVVNPEAIKILTIKA